MKIFRSVRFNIFLGALIALFSGIGTFLPQLSETPDKVRVFQQSYPQWSRLFDFLGLFELYQSWYFMGLLGLMAFDIVLCKLAKTPPDAGLTRLPPEYSREEELEKHLADADAALRLKPFLASIALSAPGDAVLAGARDFFSRSGYHLHGEMRSTSGAAAFVATRHRLQRWGSYMAHIALVLILLGSLIKGVYGFVEMVPVLEGSSRAMQNKPDWEVYVDKFTVRYYEGTLTPSHFSSEMSVRKGEEVLGAKTIIVNDPLDIGGVRFYQASWGAGGMFRSATLSLGNRRVDLPQRKPVRIPGSDISVEADVLMPNFALSADGTADTASLDLKNPALRLSFSMGPHRTSPLWLFVNQPGLCYVEGENGVLQQAPRPPFTLEAIDPVLFSGIQVAYDPGYSVVLFGSLMWLVGTISLFYMHRRRVWVHITTEGGRTALRAGGWSSRGTREFEREFALLMKGLNEKLSAGGELRLSTNMTGETL